MLVSHRHRFIYTKTLKTAGTSVESYFERFCMAEGEWSESHTREQYESVSGIVGQRFGIKPEHRWFNHMSAQRIREQLGEAVWQAYFKFCVIRNPFDKVISMFYFDLVGGRIQLDPAATETERFEAWVLNAKLPVDREVYLIDGTLCMDRILRHERLAADLAAVCEHLQLPWTPAALPTFKMGNRPRDARMEVLYTPRARQHIEEVFAFELESFGYRFGEQGSSS